MTVVTSVGITSGVPTSGTGTVSTLDNLIGTAGTAVANVLSVQGIASGTALAVSEADGVNVALGAKADAAWTSGSGSVVALNKALAGKLDTIATDIVSATLPVGYGASGAAGRVVTAALGAGVKVSVTRPSDTTGYTAGDVVGVTGGGTACITFANIAPAAGDVVITSLQFQRNVTALISGEAGYKLHLFSVTQPGAQVDNAVFDVASGDQASYLGFIQIPTPTDIGSTLISTVDGINKQVTLASTSLFGVLVTDGAYTPASATVHVVTIHAVAV